jgi:hypothetical protein
MIAILLFLFLLCIPEREKKEKKEQTRLVIAQFVSSTDREEE